MGWSGSDTATTLVALPWRPVWRVWTRPTTKSSCRAVLPCAVVVDVTITTPPGGAFPHQVPILIDAAHEITLRAHTDDDLPAMIEQSVDETTIANTTVPTPEGGYNLVHAREFLDVIKQGWEANTSQSWAIEADRDGESRYCGTLDLRLDAAQPGRASVGYALHPEARGRSVMANALRLVIDYGFDDLELSVIVWEAHVGNWASRRAAAAAGFRFEGISRAALLERGRRRDAWRASITKNDARTSMMWPRQPGFELAGLRLRPINEFDVPRLIEACNDPEIRRWLPKLPQPYGQAQALAFIQFTRETEALGTEYTWAITDADDLLLGCICAMRDPRLAQTEIGYWAHPDARGRGLVSAAVNALTAWIQGHGRAPVIRCEKANTASRAVAARAGYHELGPIGGHLSYTRD